MSWDMQEFKQKVEDGHTFPGTYTFKFIVPRERKEEVLNILPPSNIQEKESSNGKYISITSVAEIQDSQGVLDVYLAAHTIEGIIAL